MYTPIRKAEIRPGITVYQLTESSEANAPPSKGALRPASKPEREYQGSNMWPALFALVTSVVMLGSSWMMVNYFNMLLR